MRKKVSSSKIEQVDIFVWNIFVFEQIRKSRTATPYSPHIVELKYVPEVEEFFWNQIWTERDLAELSGYWLQTLRTELEVLPIVWCFRRYQTNPDFNTLSFLTSKPTSDNFSEHIFGLSMMSPSFQVTGCSLSDLNWKLLPLSSCFYFDLT